MGPGVGRGMKEQGRSTQSTFTPVEKDTRLRSARLTDSRLHSPAWPTEGDTEVSTDCRREIQPYVKHFSLDKAIYMANIAPLRADKIVCLEVGHT